MHRILTVLVAIMYAAGADARPDTIVSLRLDSGITSSNGDGVCALGDRPNVSVLTRWPPARARVAGNLALALVLLAYAPHVVAQVARNGPEWGGKDHQSTQAEVERQEDQAVVRAPPAQRQQDRRSVQQLDRQLLHEEAVDPPRDPYPNLVVTPGRPRRR